jgi:hypothetical protein
MIHLQFELTWLDLLTPYTCSQEPNPGIDEWVHSRHIACIFELDVVRKKRRRKTSLLSVFWSELADVLGNTIMIENNHCHSIFELTIQAGLDSEVRRAVPWDDRAVEELKTSSAHFLYQRGLVMTTAFYDGLHTVLNWVFVRQDLRCWIRTLRIAVLKSSIHFLSCFEYIYSK